MEKSKVAYSWGAALAIVCRRLAPHRRVPGRIQRMYSPVVISHIRAVLAHRTSLAFAGVSFASLLTALFRHPLSVFRPFGVSDAESLMNFSSLGTLRCICGAEHGDAGRADRRQFCRSCGCEVVVGNPQALREPMSTREIKALTGLLRESAIRARNLDLPMSITSVDELQRYLDGSEHKTPRTPPSQPSMDTHNVH